MRASFMKADSTHHTVRWEVSEGQRWWTVAFHTKDGSYTIMNEDMREISPTGALGKKLIAATKE